jgi:hypothetical protein
MGRRLLRSLRGRFVLALALLPDACGAPDPGASVTKEAFVRIADWSPDAPAAGIDVCLAPEGSASWIGPLLAGALPPGRLGQGGPNGVQFPTVTEYVVVATGRYDVAIVVAGEACAGSIAAGTAMLEPGAHATLASVGSVAPRGGDASRRIAVLIDDPAPRPGAAIVRFVNAVPAVPRLDAGSGSIATHDFDARATELPLGATSGLAPDGGPASSSVLPAGVDRLFSAHRSGSLERDVATATHVPLAPSSVTTMVVINGATGGFPPQFLVCTETAPPLDAQTPCSVYVY